jgi:hypothetical protein
MLDSDLAELYRVETRALVQSVKRNIERFPEDFMFQLTTEGRPKPCDHRKRVTRREPLSVASSLPL